MTALDLHHPAEMKKNLKNRFHDLTDSIPKKYTHITKYKERLEVEIRSSVNKYQGQMAYISVIRDITSLILFEKRLNQVQKIESIGVLAGGIAHDFNNLLTIINGYSQLAISKIEPENSLMKYISPILESGKKAEHLTRQLLTFSSNLIINTQIIDCNDLIQDFHVMLERLLKEDFEFKMDLSPETYNIKADPAQIHQILINLVINSKDAIDDQKNPRSKQITIKTELLRINLDFIKKHQEFDIIAGEYIKISIIDNGMGMSENIKEKIFDPFFSTKSKDKGTGLGMSTVYGIVKQNKGYIKVTSKPYVGTNVTIYWPTTSDKVLPKQNDKKGEIDLNGTENILLIEDNKNILKFAKGGMENFGYVVTTANDGLEALKKYKKSEWDIIITDIIMPHLSGIEFFESINSTFPLKRIIFTSGYTDNKDIEKYKKDKDFNFVQKPYTLNQLLLLVRRILNNEDNTST
jgi:signal transduction histidine kinase/ActR/RegA family two-component response regulator